jgi:hypothetical protein
MRPFEGAPMPKPELKPLLPCLCGSMPMIEMEEDVFSDVPFVYGAICYSCGKKTNQFETRELAISAWNNRPEKAE